MNWESLRPEYPHLDADDFEEMNTLTTAERIERFGHSLSEYREMKRKFEAAVEANQPFYEEFDDDDSEPWLFDPAREVQKLYAVKVLSHGPVPEVAMRRFADLYPEKFVNGEFWVPTANRLYRSLSGAKARADLLGFNGVECEVVETSTSWRKHETKKEYYARLERENAELRARLGEVA